MSALRKPSLPEPSPWLASRIAASAPEHLTESGIVKLSEENPAYYAYLYNEYCARAERPYLMADTPSAISPASEPEPRKGAISWTLWTVVTWTLVIVAWAALGFPLAHFLIQAVTGGMR